MVSKFPITSETGNEYLVKVKISYNRKKYSEIRGILFIKKKILFFTKNVPVYIDFFEDWQSTQYNHFIIHPKDFVVMLVKDYERQNNIVNKKQTEIDKGIKEFKEWDGNCKGVEY